MNGIKIEMDSLQNITLRHALNKGGKVQQFFTSEVARMCDPYVPFDTGNLKNNKEVSETYIHYKSPYAKKQHEQNRGGHNGPLRGKQWEKRMWTDRGNEIVRAVENYARNGV